MTRVRRGVVARRRRKNLLEMTKGYRWKRKSHYRAAKEANLKAGKYAYRDRRTKKRTFRSLWIIRLGNALRKMDMNYSRFIALLKQKQVGLDRKVLSELAIRDNAAFKTLVEKVKGM